MRDLRTGPQTKPQTLFWRAGRRVRWGRSIIRRRTRDAGITQPELLHLGRELELRHIAWERGEGEGEERGEEEEACGWSANQTSNLVLAEMS